MTNIKITLKRLIIILLTSLTAAASLISAAIITGLYDNFMLIISSVFFGVIFYFCLKSSYWLDIILKFILSGVFAFVFYKITWENNLFYNLFINKFPEYGAPNAGTEFTILASFVINFSSAII
ncbi:MAG: hypothetical protein K2N72_13545, partial [Oscillospiraceae bacterium]|nr:hypothetical protein [Oscillospiraceae bacterium]